MTWVSGRLLATSPDDEHAIGPAGRGHHSVGGHIAVRKAGTHDVEVHCATRDAQTGGDHGAGCGKRLFWRGRAQHEEADVIRREIRSGDPCYETRDELRGCEYL